MEQILHRLASKGWAVFSKKYLDEVIKACQDDFDFKWEMTAGGGWRVVFHIVDVKQ